jgi:hypothetical protein
MILKACSRSLHSRRNTTKTTTVRLGCSTCSCPADIFLMIFSIYGQSAPRQLVLKLWANNSACALTRWLTAVRATTMPAHFCMRCSKRSIKHSTEPSSTCPLADPAPDRSGRLHRSRRRQPRSAASEMTSLLGVKDQHQTHGMRRSYYSITSSARTSNEGGTVRPSALAVFMLIMRTNLVGLCTGRSAGLVPLRILST